MEEVENSSSSITHLLCFLSHRGRSSLAHSLRVVREVRAFDGERGAIVRLPRRQSGELARAVRC